MKVLETGGAGFTASNVKSVWLQNGKQSTVSGDGTKTGDCVGDLVNANMSVMFSEADLCGETDWVCLTKTAVLK